MARVHTLLHTDLVDSTAINARLGDDAMAHVWDQHDAGSRDLLRRWRGREIDRSDGFMVLFESPVDAAGFVFAYHRLLSTLPVPIKARAGMHVGPLGLRENTPADVALGAKPLEVVGIAKAISARMMALAQGGQTLASASAAAALAATEWRCQSHGHWRMKGWEEPVEVFEIGDEQSAFLPPPDGEKSHRVLRVDGSWVGARQVDRRLPAERARFFGRQGELRAMAQAFDDGARLLTLHGPGGIGKTRLALRHGWGWLGDYTGGVWFCDLAPARGLDGIVHAVMQGMGVPPHGEPVAHLGHAIAGRGRCLVILDNFEQVTRHAAATLGCWLDAAPAAHFVVTSREVLGLPGEHTLALAPLASDDAVALFHKRAEAANASYAPAAADVTVMRALVALLEGLPLAIELAAARVTVLAPHELLARMSDRFRLLAVRGGRPDRQATLRATLDWSWEWLEPAERSALAQLSVFEGGFTLCAAQSVIALGEGDEAAWTLDLLQSLVAKSLLPAAHEGRYALLSSIQEYAAGQLAAGKGFPGSGSTLVEALRRRHQRHFSGLDEAAATAARCAELDNLVAACRHAMADGDVRATTACLRLSWAALRLTGPLRLARELADKVLEMPQLDGESAATAGWVRGAALYTLGDNAEARLAIGNALLALPTSAAPVLAARLHCAMGEILTLSGNTADATRHLEAARAQAETSREPAVVCQVLNAIGALAADQGRLGEARSNYERALDLAESAGIRNWQGGLLGNLGNLHHAEGRLDDARSAFERAVGLATDSGDRRWEGNAHCNLGLVHHEQGRTAEAEVELNSALAMARQLGYRQLEFTVLCNLGIVFEAQGEHLAACVNFQAAVDGMQALADVRSEGMFRSYLGVALARLGRYGEARACLQRGRMLLEPVDDVFGLGRVFCSLSESEHLAGDLVSAQIALAQARQLLLRSRAGADSELGRDIGRIADAIGSVARS